VTIICVFEFSLEVEHGHIMTRRKSTRQLSVHRRLRYPLDHPSLFPEYNSVYPGSCSYHQIKYQSRLDGFASFISFPMDSSWYQLTSDVRKFCTMMTSMCSSSMKIIKILHIFILFTRNWRHCLPILHILNRSATH
jgi:hypothetical protein